MARRALHHKGDLTEYVTVHSLCSPKTRALIGLTCGMIALYWMISPRHVIRKI